MMTPAQLAEIRKRVESGTADQDVVALLAETERLAQLTTDFSAQVNGKLDSIMQDMESLERENARLRRVCESTYFERDACIGLIARMAVALGCPAGIGTFESLQENSEGQKVRQVTNRVVIDLPTGQVSWDYLESEAHLFAWLPQYSGALEEQGIRDVYSKVMNPGIGGDVHA